MHINEKYIDNELIEIPEGFIRMRDDRTNKVWNEKIDTFYISKYTVTNQFYAQIMDLEMQDPDRGHYPVESVSWFDAVRFCNKLSQLENIEPFYEIKSGSDFVEVNKDSKGYRLPTEAEWEYACRAGSSEYRYGPIEDIAWYFENSNEQIHEVGQKQPNQWGLYDMIGNVWEWCHDLYDPEVYGTYRIFRGGGWFDYERSCGASCRRRSHPTAQFDDLGFRIARTK